MKKNHFKHSLAWTANTRNSSPLDILILLIKLAPISVEAVAV